MDIFFHDVFRFFFFIGYVILYIVSIIILRPFRLHKKRKKSTIALKISYLIYLAIFLVFTYLLLFGNKELSEDDQPYDTIFNKYFLIFLTATIIPNLGIMLRRQIKKKRIEYNLIFTLVNLLYFAYLLYMIISRQWALL
jgi:NADH:ubiquinone oxidoreductase subunit 6 (subunit J)